MVKYLIRIFLKEIMFSHQMKIAIKEKFLVLGILILLAIMIFSGCTSETNNNSKEPNESQKFIGTWNHGSLPNTRIIFSSNSVCEFQGEDSRWNLNENKLEINIVDTELTLKFDYNFLDNNQILELINNDTDPPQIDDYRKQ
jgi:hypothetical protein